MEKLSTKARIPLPRSPPKKLPRDCKAFVMYRERPSIAASTRSLTSSTNRTIPALLAEPKSFSIAALLSTLIRSISSTV